jgi:hypothetical protein
MIPPISSLSFPNQDMSRDETVQGRAARRDAQAPAGEPALAAGYLQRFHALVEEVTDELMHGAGQGLVIDRNDYRSDAIALLIGAARQLEQPEEQMESPLMSLLLEERHKIAAQLGGAATSDRTPFLLKA